METSLPLELQHGILKLAIPPFSYRTLSSRRETCRSFALVHRSWTPIAQAELQRYFRIKGSVDHAGSQAEKALVARALEEDWPVQDLVIEDDGVPVQGGRTTALPHPLLKMVKRAIVGTVFSEAALRPSTMPNLRELTIVEIPAENKQWWPDNRIPSTLFYPSLTRLHLVEITLHSLPPLPHLDTLLLTYVSIAAFATFAHNTLPRLRSLGCKEKATDNIRTHLIFFKPASCGLQNILLSAPREAYLDKSLSLTPYHLRSSGGVTETYIGEADSFELEDWRPE